MLRTSRAISHSHRCPNPGNRPQRPDFRHAHAPAPPNPAAKRFVQKAFRIGVAMRKALSVFFAYQPHEKITRK